MVLSISPHETTWKRRALCGMTFVVHNANSGEIWPIFMLRKKPNLAKIHIGKQYVIFKVAASRRWHSELQFGIRSGTPVYLTKRIPSS